MTVACKLWRMYTFKSATWADICLIRWEGLDVFDMTSLTTATSLPGYHSTSKSLQEISHLLSDLTTFISFLLAQSLTITIGKVVWFQTVAGNVHDFKSSLFLKEEFAAILSSIVKNEYFRGKTIVGIGI